MAQSLLSVPLLEKQELSQIPSLFPFPEKKELLVNLESFFVPLPFFALLQEFQNRKEQKRQEIQVIYDAAKGDLEEWLPLSKIYDVTWENSTCSKKKIREEILARMEASTSCRLSSIVPRLLITLTGTNSILSSPFLLQNHKKSFFDISF